MSSIPQASVKRALALTFAPVLVAGVVLAATAALPVPQSEDYPKPTFAADGKLIRPDLSYREWVYVGTPLTPNELNPPEAPFPEFHNVYIHPDDFDHYSRTGEFPDGTVIVKELVTVGSTQAVSGRGYFMGEYGTGVHHQGRRAVPRRARELGLLQFRP